MRRIAAALGAVVVAIALLALAGSLFGHPPVELLMILLRGSVG
jgi:hypothetical protein